MSNMTPKLKAKELVEKFIEPTKVPNIKHIWVEDIDAAKQCALIAVNEVINNVNGMLDFESDIEFWQEVKQEIQKL